MRRTACGCEVGEETPHGGLDEMMAAAPQMSGSDVGEAREPEMAPMCDRAVGARTTVVEVSAPGAPPLERRLNDLGFVPGAVVDVLRRAPLGDPVVYRVCDYEVCLRRDQAALVLTGSVPAVAGI